MLHPENARHQAKLVIPLLALAVGCASPPTAPPLEDRNVLLIVVDTLGARHVGAWNPALSRTPKMDAFAASGVRFARAYATAPWTQPSVASILTGRLPSAHGVHNIRDVLDETETTLAERLAGRGYRTRGVISHHLIGAALGYDQGFERYDESAVGGHTGISSAKVTDAAIRELDELREQRFFLLAHYFDPHYYYHHHAAYDRTSSYAGPLVDVDDIWDILAMRPQLQPADVGFLRDRHLEEIAFVDEHVGRLLDHLDASGLSDSTIVVLVADHGEEFMERGWIGHTRTLYDELLHVPLAMRVPGLTRPAIADAPVSVADIVPTLLALSRREESLADLDGRSLLPFLTGQIDDAEIADVFAEVSFMPPSLRQQEKLSFKTALIAGELKLIHDRRTDAWELYDLSRDPLEQQDLAGVEPRLREGLAKRLGDWEATRDLPTRFTLDALDDLPREELDRLRSLGYIN